MSETSKLEADATLSARAALALGEDWDAVTQALLADIRRQGDPQPSSIALVFVTPNFKNRFEEIIERIRFEAKAVHLVGCTAAGLIGNSREVEGSSGISLLLLRLPKTELTPYHFSAGELESENPPGYWLAKTGVRAEAANGWLLFGDPLHTPCDRLIAELNQNYPGKPLIGGLAGAGTGPGGQEQEVALFLDNQIFTSGAVGIAIGRGTRVDAIIAQGCTPIGQPHTITKVDQNLIFEIGSQPAYDVLVDTVKKLDSDTQFRARGNLFIGLVTNEYLDEYKRGDFLVRNILGANPEQGVLAVGALPKPGQTLQFQLRDKVAAHDELVGLLDATRRKLGHSLPAAALICSCNGRGVNLFQTPNHDAEQVSKTFDAIQVGGFFCNGEIGPVGDKNFLHGYTAAIALFTREE